MVEHHAQYINAWKGPIAAGGHSGHLSTGVEQLYCASLAFLGLYSSLSLLFNAIIIIIISSI